MTYTKVVKYRTFKINIWVTFLTVNYPYFITFTWYLPMSTNTNLIWNGEYELVTGLGSS